MTLLEEFKEYLRVDGDDENSSLSTFLSTAKVALDIAGVRLPQDLIEVDTDGEKKYPLHFLAVITLASHYYENRQVASNQAQNIVPFSVQHMILQLKLVNIDESSEISTSD